MELGAFTVSRSTLASITRHYASSAYPRRDYKFGQILSRFLSFALPFADTNDRHGTSSYVIQSRIIVDQHPLCRELPSTSQRSSYAPIDQHTPFNDSTSSVITFISSRTIHEQDKLTYDPYQPPLPSSTMTQSTISTWRGYINHGNWYTVYWSRGTNTHFCLHHYMSRWHIQYLFDQSSSRSDRQSGPT